MKFAKDLDSLNEYITKGNGIFLYGAGLYGKSLYLFLTQHHIKAESFVVSEKPIRKEWQGVSIQAINDVEIKESDVVIVSVAPKSNDEIIKKIKDNNTVPQIIIISNNLWKEIMEMVDYSKVQDEIETYYVQTLIFHRVSNKTNDPWKLSITPEVFEENIKLIKDRYEIVRFEEDWENNIGNLISITFDDGYVDNYKNALPILEKYNVPATIFVASGNIGSDKEFWWDELSRMIEGEELVNTRKTVLNLNYDERKDFFDSLRIRFPYKYDKYQMDRSMNEEELKQLAKSELITIGAHTINHSMLSALPLDEMQNEISGNKEYLEEILGRRITVFSYPFGGKESYNINVLNAVKNCGFKKAATNINGLFKKGDSVFEIPRCGIGTPENLIRIIDRNRVIYS